MSIERDRNMERAFVGSATRYMNGDAGAFLERVLARLDRAEYAAGGNEGWLERSLGDLAGEMLEEAEDIAGWGVGLNYRLSRDVTDPALREALRIRLLAAIARGALAWDEVATLAERLGELEEEGSRAA